jgi:CubicO group peptidase (beta-lactamase class C family)
MTVDWSAFEVFRADRPGCVAAIARAGDPVAWRSCGSHGPDGAALTVRTPFYVASVAKQITAAVIASLVAERAVGLDDGVRRWFPSLGAV